LHLVARVRHGSAWDARVSRSRRPRPPDDRKGATQLRARSRHITSLAVARPSNRASRSQPASQPATQPASHLSSWRPGRPCPDDEREPSRAPSRAPIHKKKTEAEPKPTPGTNEPDPRQSSIHRLHAPRKRHGPSIPSATGRGGRCSPSAPGIPEPKPQRAGKRALPILVANAPGGHDPSEGGTNPAHGAPTAAFRGTRRKTPEKRRKRPNIQFLMQKTSHRHPKRDSHQPPRLGCAKRKTPSDAQVLRNEPRPTARQPNRPPGRLPTHLADHAPAKTALRHRPSRRTKRPTDRAKT
jgi:hypothetical protein